MRTRQHRCPHCREIFVPDSRNVSGQRYCPKEDCQRARNRGGARVNPLNSN